MGSAGIVSHVSGQAFALRGGQRIALEKGSELLVSDAVRTEDDAQLEVRFTDGTEISLGPLTQVQIRDFAFDPAQAVEPAFAMHIMEGFARTVSGEVVKQNPNAFKLSSPMGTAGIRGTTIEAIIASKEEFWRVAEMGKGHTVIFATSDGHFLRVVDAQGEGVRFMQGSEGPQLAPLSYDQLREVLREQSERGAPRNTRDDDQGVRDEGSGSSGQSESSSGILIVGLEEDLQRLADLELGDDVSFLVLDQNLYAKLQDALGGEEESPSLATDFVPGNETRNTGDHSIISGNGNNNHNNNNKVSDGPWTGERAAYTGGDWISATGANDFYVNRPEIGVSGASGHTLHSGKGSDRVIFFGQNNVVSGGYGSADTIICVGDMLSGVIYGDQDVIGNVSGLDNDVIIIRGSTSGFGWNETEERLMSMSPAGYAAADLGVSLYGDAAELASCGAGNDSIYVYGNVLAGGAIYGDAATVSGASALGHDSIAVVNVTGAEGNLYGAIYGDAVTLQAGLAGGADAISVAGNMGGGAVIYGDAENMEANAVGGADRISLGSMSDSFVYGDARDMAAGATGGNDSIAINGNVTNSYIYGDAENMASGATGGNDVISVGGNVSGTHIHAGSGANSVTIAGTLTDGSITTGNGNDVVSVNVLGDGANISLGGGTDDLRLLGVASGASVRLDFGADFAGDVLDLSQMAATGALTGDCTLTLYNFDTARDIIKIDLSVFTPPAGSAAYANGITLNYNGHGLALRFDAATLQGDPGESIVFNSPVGGSIASGGNLHPVLDEAEMSGGSNAQAGGATGSGSFTLDAASSGGLASLTIGSATIDLSGSGLPQVVSAVGDPYRLTVTGVAESNGTYTITYNCQLTTAVDHQGQASTSRSLDYTAVGKNTLLQSRGVIELSVRDDAPLAVADTASIASGGVGAAVSGNVLTNDTFGSDGRAGASGLEPLGVSIGSHGELILNADGSYTYTQTAENTSQSAVADTFTYTLTDSDGSTSQAALVITIPASTIIWNDPDWTGSDAAERFIGLASGSYAINGGGGNDVLSVVDNTANMAGGGGNDTLLLIGASATGTISGDGTGAAALGNDLIIARALGAAEPRTSASYLESGDASNFAPTTFTGTIYGDAQTMAPGATGGKDSIVIHGDVADSRIYGDARDMAAGAAGGNDSIVIHGNVANSHVYGDAGTMAVGASGGNDAIRVNGNADNTEIHAGSGANSVTITGTLTGGSITTGDGNDVISVGSVSATRIHVGGGNDAVSVNVLADGASISLGGGADSVRILGVASGAEASVYFGADLAGDVLDLSRMADTGALTGNCTLTLYNFDIYRDAINLGQSILTPLTGSYSTGITLDYNGVGLILLFDANTLVASNPSDSVVFDAVVPGSISFGGALNQSLNEAGLSGGSDPQGGGAAVSGTFTIDATQSGGLSSLVFGSTAIDLSGSGIDQKITPAGAPYTLTITGVNDNGNSIYTLTYICTLTAAVTHVASSPASYSLAYTAVGTDTSIMGTGQIDIIVIDDAPVAVADTAIVSGGINATVSGNLLANDTFGADGRASVSGLALQGSATGTYGELNLNENGTYTYTYTKDNTSQGTAADTFTYTITDKDGSTSQATLTITIPASTIIWNDPDWTGSDAAERFIGLASGSYAINGGGGNDVLSVVDNTANMAGGGGNDTLLLIGASTSGTISGDEDDAASTGDDLIIVRALGAAEPANSASYFRTDDIQNFGKTTFSGTIYGDEERINSGTCGADSIIITGAVTGSYIHGDAHYIAGGLSGGNDSIEIYGDVAGSSIYGDAASLSAFFGGNDAIILRSLLNSKVYGDGQSISANPGSRDSITVEGNVTDSYIYGDAEEIYSSTCGADNIGLGGINNSSIYGDGAVLTGSSGGADSIIAHDPVGSFIYGDGEVLTDSSGGADHITVDGNVVDTCIYGDAASHQGTVVGGNDTILFVQGILKGSSLIDGGPGDDLIIVNWGVDGTSVLQGGSGNDSIGVFSTLGGAAGIYGGDGNDLLFADKIAPSAKIEGGSGNDSIVLGQQISTADYIHDGGTLKADQGDDIMSISGHAKDITIELGDGANTLGISGNLELTGGSAWITGGDGGNDIRIGGNLTGNGFTGMEIATGTGNNSLYVGGQLQFSGPLTCGAGNDLVYLKGGVAAGAAPTISLGDGADTIVIATLTGGTSLTIDFGASDAVQDVLDLSGVAGFGSGAEATITLDNAMGSSSDQVYYGSDWTATAAGMNELRLMHQDGSTIRIQASAGVASLEYTENSLGIVFQNPPRISPPELDLP